MDEGTGILPGLPAVAGKPVHLRRLAAGLMTSDAGILTCWRQPSGGLGSPERLADCIEDRVRAGARVRHTLAEMIRFPRPADRGGLSRRQRLHDALRADPAFKMAVRAAPRKVAPICARNRPSAGLKTCPARPHSGNG